MPEQNLKKGLLFGFISAFIIGTAPIVANSRPSELDFYIFAAMTNLVELVIFCPLFMVERKKFKDSLTMNLENLEVINSQLHGWKNNKKILLAIGIIFTVVPAFNFLGLEFAGAINGSLVLKTRILFTLLFGYLILREKVTKLQVLFSFVLFFGLTLAITQGSFNLLEFNFGVIVLLINVIISPIGHILAKSVLDRNEITPFQIIVIRNLISFIILFSTYFLFFPLENIKLFLDPINYFWFILMGFNYGFGILFWYKTISYLEIGKAMILLSFTTIVTVILATAFLGEDFTYLHIVGMIIMIFSTIIIIKQKRE